MVKCIDTDKIHVEVKDLHLLQGQGQNLSLSFFLRVIFPPFTGGITYTAVMVFFEKNPQKLRFRRRSGMIHKMVRLSPRRYADRFNLRLDL